MTEKSLKSDGMSHIGKLARGKWAPVARVQREGPASREVAGLEQEATSDEQPPTNLERETICKQTI
ncbi:hypothetical protein Tdes44962_MAKER08864 [Teratosphaeria destructans]|uniref:Uncharacterized protein n=1 Tax=Teratosphaeria destructans TaxID=418781 RepID=A0A9W7SV12_9PEZI|nr:hypothetical protein Tdes44962_MAKER08864 [Teratosphaeria destructans]